jgi:osmoprotectant transport system ATP-binding protein
MDEPFGAIDPVNRAIIQDEFLALQRRLCKTVIFVSHDIDEALRLGSRIAILREGELVQYDTPAVLLAQPADPFVTSFVGNDRVLRHLRLLTVADALDEDLRDIGACALQPDKSLSEAATLMEQCGQTNLVVVDKDGRAAGLVRLQEARRWKEGVVRDHMQILPDPVHPGDDLHAAASSMLALGLTALPCIDQGGRFVGYVTPGGIARALNRRGERSAPLAAE